MRFPLPATLPAGILACLLTWPALGETGQGFESSIRLQLTPLDHTILSSEIAGKVSAITVREGESFNKGDTLLRMDCSLHEARLAKAEAQALEARKVEQVNKQLDQMGTISHLEFDVAAARLAAAEAETRLMSGIVERCEVKAPFSGKVSQLLVRAHQSVAESQELMEILDDSALEMEMFVPSSWLTWVKPGLRFNLQIDETGGSYPAIVERISPAVDAVSQSVKLYGRIIGSFPELRAGMSGTANLGN